MTRVLTIFCIIILGLGYFSSASSPKEQIGLQIKGQVMSAELHGVSLRMVLERLEDEKGIWFKGDESALEERVFVRFDDLPLHEGLRRILSTVNHVLVFDRERGLVGLFVLGKKDPGRRAPRDGGVGVEKSPPSQPAGETAVSRDPFEDRPFADMPSTPESPFGESVASSPEDPFAASATSSSEGPFEKGVFPSSKDPFADSFDESPESRGGRR